MRILKTNILVFIFLMISLFARSQTLCDTLAFIACDQNKIIFNEADSNLANLIHKFQFGNSEKIQIVHIGDSHLQAGFLTEKIKQILFQHFYANDSFASPGFIFHTP